MSTLGPTPCTPGFIQSESSFSYIRFRDPRRSAFKYRGRQSRCETSGYSQLLLCKQFSIPQLHGRIPEARKLAMTEKIIGLLYSCILRSLDVPFRAVMLQVCSATVLIRLCLQVRCTHRIQSGEACAIGPRTYQWPRLMLHRILWRGWIARCLRESGKCLRV